MYDEILIPTDGSDPSMVAVDQGVAAAERFDAHVHLLHVVDVGTEMSASGAGTLAEELTETLDAVAEEATDRALERAEAAGVSVRTATLEGVPHRAITADSADHDLDLVVIGESGRSGRTEQLLGSTTDRVVRSADVSVLVARSR